MQVVQVMGTIARSVQFTNSLRSQRNEDGTYNLEGDSFGFQSIHAGDIAVLPDDVVLEDGQELPEDWYEEAISLDSFLTLTHQMALADALGLLLRSSVAEGRVSDDELLRIAPVLEERAWRPDLSVEVGDVYACDDAIWRCVTGHTTQTEWRPPLVSALWRKIERLTDGPRVWQTLTDYLVDDLVHYPDAHGPAYRCTTGHTSQEGWEPPNVPALWEAREAQ